MARSVLGLKRGLAARTLPALIGVMVFVGLLALAAGLAVNGAVEGWSRNIDLGLTATVPDASSSKVDSVILMLRQTPGSPRPAACPTRKWRRCWRPGSAAGRRRPICPCRR